MKQFIILIATSMLLSTATFAQNDPAMGSFSDQQNLSQDSSVPGKKIAKANKKIAKKKMKKDQKHK